MSERTPTAWTIVGLLTDFYTEDEVIIDPDLRIRLMPSMEFDILVDLIPDGEWDDYDLGWLTDVLTDMSWVISRGVSAGNPDRLLGDAVTSFKRTVAALRLLAPGDVRLSVIAYYPIDRDHVDRGYLRTLTPPARRAKYFFSLAKREELRHLMQALEPAPRTPTVARAIAHFDQIYALEKPADQLLRCWAGLEALFWDNSRDRAYRQSWLVPWRASIMSGAAEPRLRESYCNPRSKTIHGQHHPAAIRREEVELAMEALRSSLRSAVGAPESLGRVRMRYPPQRQRLNYLRSAP